MPRRPNLALRARAAAMALALGALAAAPPLAPPVSAQAADVTLENLSFPLGPATYRVPRLRVLGTPLGRPELEAILSAASPEPVPARIARLQAREITAPEVIVEADVAGSRQRSVYRDVVLSGVGGGRIRSLTSAGGTVAGGGKAGDMQGGFGRFSAEEIDLGHAVALFTEKAGPTPAPIKTLYGKLTLEDFSVRAEPGVTSRFARIEARDVAARLTPDTWLGFFRMAQANPDLEKASPAERQRVLSSFADLFEAFSFGAMEMSGTEFTSTAPQASTTRIARIALTGTAAGRPNEFVVEGIDVVAGDTAVKLGRFSVTDVSLGSSLETLRNLPPSGEGLSPGALRKMVPTIGRIGLSGLNASFPYGKGKGRAADPMRVSLAGAEVTAGKPLQGVPTDTRLALRNLAFALPDTRDNEAVAEIVRLGYDRLDLSLVLSALYEPEKQELTLREFTIVSQDMGSVGLKAVLGGVPPEVFDPDTAVASVALLGASARSLTLNVANSGLAERVLTLKARQQGRTAEDLRREYGMMAVIGVPAMLGSSPAAKTIGQAVAQFVAKPGRIVIDAKAKAAGGFGVADFAAGADPASVLEKLDVTARVE